MRTLEPLPTAVAAALDAASFEDGRRVEVMANGIPFSSIAWGAEQAARPLVLVHGITASARIWWRVGPALAASGRWVVAPDLPGHGRTGHWAGRYRFRDTAADLAAWIRAAGLDLPGLQVVGHSWGAMTTAALPAVGLRPATLVLVDPPCLPVTEIARMAAESAAAATLPSRAAIRDALAAANPGWSADDVEATAEALGEFELEAAKEILFQNGDWDGGLADLADPAALDVPVRVIRGEPPAGSLLPDALVPAFAARAGAGHVVTIPGAPHSPQRTHPAELTAAILAALG